MGGGVAQGLHCIASLHVIKIILLSFFNAQIEETFQKITRIGSYNYITLIHPPCVMWKLLHISHHKKSLIYLSVSDPLHFDVDSDPRIRFRQEWIWIRI